MTSIPIVDWSDPADDEQTREIPAAPPIPLRSRRSGRTLRLLREIRSDLIILLPWAVLVGIGSAHLGASLLHAVAATLAFSVAYEPIIKRWIHV